MKIYIVRHGETIENQKGILQGTIPGILSKKGKIDANLIANKFKNEKLDLIISSDLKRSLDTAKIISQFHPKTEFIINSDLRERDYGIYNGKLRSIVSKNHHSVETKTAMYERAQKVVRLIESKNLTKNIIIVGHGSINKVIIGALLKKDLLYISKLGLIANSSITTIDWSKSKSRLVTFSVTEHLRYNQ